MSYQALARKWRPRTFESLIGQEHVVKALTHALDQNRLHHAYLFTGTRGVGKTTLARILAKSLNCETGISSHPCGKCSACIEIDSSRFVDLIEIDAATNTGVDDMRELLENAVYAPTRGRFKVYVIDEVHMLSKPAFNSMLKTLEEPPEHVKFILATTDPQKIPVTVLSRCLQFNLKQMPALAITAHLARILGEEKMQAEDGALALLARSAQGSMRDALSLLDQAIAYSAGNVTEGAVRAMLGAIDDTFLYAIMDGIARGDAGAVLAIAEEMQARDVSFDGALQELGALLHRVALWCRPRQKHCRRRRPSASGWRSSPGRSIRKRCSSTTRSRFTAVRTWPWPRTTMPGSPMALLRMLAFRPETGTEGKGAGLHRRTCAAGSGPRTGGEIGGDSGGLRRRLAEACQLARPRRYGEAARAVERAQTLRRGFDGALHLARGKASCGKDIPGQVERGAAGAFWQSHSAGSADRRNRRQ